MSKLPKEGNLAPNFTLQNQDEKLVSLKDYRDKKNVLIYFYPKAMTPGCTTQAGGIRDFKKQYAKANTVVLAISPDVPKRLKKFEDKENLNFNLLSDPDHSVADKYGSWGDKKFMGKEYQGILRQSFIVGRDGKLKKIFEKVKTKTHHEDMLEYINEFLD